MTSKRSLLTGAVMALGSFFAPMMRMANAQAGTQATVWPIEVPYLHDNFLQLFGLLSTQHALNGRAPARAFTVLFPFNPTTPGTIDSINSRGDVIFSSGQVTNQGVPGIYQFDDANVGRVTFRLPARVDAICTNGDQGLTLDFFGTKPKISFAKLPPVMAGMPKSFEIYSMFVSEERTRIILVDAVKQQNLILEIVHLLGAKAFVNNANSARALGMMAALRIVARSPGFTLCNCKGSECKPGDLPHDPDFCVGYYSRDPKKECRVMTDDDVVSWNKNCRDNPNSPFCKERGDFVTFSCKYDSDAQATSAIGGELADKCKN